MKPNTTLMILGIIIILGFIFMNNKKPVYIYRPVYKPEYKPYHRRGYIPHRRRHSNHIHSVTPILPQMHIDSRKV